MSSHLLITGADGHVGRLLARRWLDEERGPLTLAHRAGATFAERAARLEARLGPGARGRVRHVPLDLAAEQPLGTMAPDVERIAHGAAVVRFNVAEDLARAVNIEGTRKILDFAQRCPRLDSFALLSTVYATGLTAGPIDEAPARAAEFANFYEWSKAAAEQDALARDLPVRVLRIATVICDDADGTVSRHNVFHQTLRLLYYGLLSLVPGHAATPLYLVDGAFVARAIAGLLDPAARGVYHLSHDHGSAPTLQQLLARAFERFAASPDFTRRRVLPPLLADRAAYELLVNGTRGFGGAVLQQALDSLAPFAPQLYVGKGVSNARLRSALPAVAPSDPSALVDRTLDTLIRTRWHSVAGEAA